MKNYKYKHPNWFKRNILRIKPLTCETNYKTHDIIRLLWMGELQEFKIIDVWYFTKGKKQNKKLYQAMKVSALNPKNNKCVAADTFYDRIEPM